MAATYKQVFDPAKRYAKGIKEKHSKSPSPAEVKELRETFGKTQLEMALLMLSTHSTYQKWEGGQRPMHPYFWQNIQRDLADEAAQKAEFLAKAANQTLNS
jgi:DNA-binding XRE family transcriptional regulator